MSDRKLKGKSDSPISSNKKTSDKKVVKPSSPKIVKPATPPTANNVRPTPKRSNSNESIVSISPERLMSKKEKPKTSDKT